MSRDMFANGARTRAIYFVSVAFHLKVRLSQGAELCKSSKVRDILTYQSDEKEF